jgi:tetratricopeptide (TPR) repeat protein
MRIRLLLAALPLFVCCLPAGYALPAAGPPPQPRLHHPVSSSSPLARDLFDQGLYFLYAFNHDEAVRCFQEAARVDPGFALAHWGVALALGPSINLKLDPPRKRAAFEALQRALALSNQAPEPERAYIRALAKRYSGAADGDPRKLATDYQEAMRELSRSYPDDPDAATLFAQSLMELRPGQLWTADGSPAPGTPELVAVLESVLRRHPGHLGANVFYIHAVAASPHPEWALPSAQRLQAMGLDAGHLVHLPSHVYLRVGDYAQAARCNEAAVTADQGYLEREGSGGSYSMLYYSHNLHFLAVASVMQGRQREALGAAERLAAQVAPAADAMPMLDFMLSTRELVLARFHNWPELLQTLGPRSKTPYSQAIGHFALALAFAGTGDLQRARSERALFREAAGKTPAEATVDLNRALDVLWVAGCYLDARLARSAGDLAGAAELLRKGIAQEDALRRTEPPSWLLPLREPLGGLLLQAGNFSQAEAVFREELARNPRSGRALYGLWESLQGQGKAYEAHLVRREYEAAWKDAERELDRAGL